MTRTRRAFDRALAALPVTQHDRIWPLFLRFIGQPGMPPETAVRVSATAHPTPVTCRPAAACLPVCRLPAAAGPQAAARRLGALQGIACRPTTWVYCLQVYRRYLRLEPGHAEEYIAYLRGQERWGEMARRLADIVNDEMFRWGRFAGAS